MFKSSLLAAIVGTVPALLSGEYQSSEVLAMKSATVTAPGAKIYYEVRGSGPTLLLISGGPLDAGIYANLAQRLSDRYTVVTYDPRGNSRSTFDVAPVDTPMDVHGDDAARLIETLGGGPAYVFGSS